MTISSYSDLQLRIGDWLGHDVKSSRRYPEFITLFEAKAARKLRARLQETTTILVFTAATSHNITNAANNGSGLIRLTVASTSDLATNDLVIVSSVGGTTEANTEWAITVINPTTLDLQGSTFTHTYTSGGTVIQVQGQAALPTDYISTRRATWVGAQRTALQYLDPFAFQTFYPNLQFTETSGTPQHYTIEAGNIIIGAAATGNVEFVYYAKTAAVSGALNWLFTNHPDIYLFGALAEAGGYVSDDAQLMRWAQRRDEIFEEIRVADFKERAGMAIRPLSFTP